MMNKKSLVKIIFFLILIIMFLSAFQTTMAWSVDIDKDFSRDETLVDPDKTGMLEARDIAAKIISNAISIVQVLGLGIAVIMLTALGIKYMVGSIEDKAQIKKHLMVYAIGAIVFFAAASILQIIQGFIKANFVV